MATTECLSLVCTTLGLYLGPGPSRPSVVGSLSLARCFIRLSWLKVAEGVRFIVARALKSG